MRSITLALSVLLATATSLTLSLGVTGPSHAAPATSAHVAVTAPTVIKPRQGYGDWIGGRHAGPVNYMIDDMPNADMSKIVRTLSINAHTDRQIHYKAILGTGAERRVMTGWVGGHGTKAQNHMPHMDFFFGLRPDENYRTIQILRIP